MGTTQERFQQMVGERIKFARAEAGMTQEQLSAKLGFKDRQILANVEGGKRKVAADELVKLMETLKKPIDFFTDPLILVGEGMFCWRASASAAVLDSFEAKAKPIVAAYREFCLGHASVTTPIHHELRLTKRSSYREAQAAAEALVVQWKLQGVPGPKLAEAVEDRLGVAVLHVDAPPGISGAACRLPEVNVVLISRNEPMGRRSFDLAHELFHLLTWNEMPPKHVEKDVPGGNKKSPVEYLADNFASALLMPRESLQPLWEGRGQMDINEFIVTTSQRFLVSGQALFYRLINLGWLTEGDRMDIKMDRLSWPDTGEKPKLYSERFVKLLHRRLEEGWLSVRRATKVLDCSMEELGDLFRLYELEPPFDL